MANRQIARHLLLFTAVVLGWAGLGAVAPRAREVLTQLFSSQTTTKLCPSIGQASASCLLRIATLGDSITFGHCSTNPANTSWPAVLESLLNADFETPRFEVLNFGVMGTTMMASSRSFFNTTEYDLALESSPHIVTIMLGTNDAGVGVTWDEVKYLAGYQKMITALKLLDPPPVVIPMVPPPDYNSSDYDDVAKSRHVVNKVLPDLIRNIANDYDYENVDCFSVFGGSAMDHLDWMCEDGIHANDLGYHHIATAVERHVKSICSNAYD